MSQFRMADLFEMLGIRPPDLLLRSYGRKAFPTLERALQQVPTGHTLLHDCTGIAVMDTSFAEETLIELTAGLAAGKYGDRYIVLESPSPEVLDNLDGAIARKRLKLAFLVIQNEKKQIVGHIEANLLETWHLLDQTQKLTARELADRLALEINTASMRLRKLYNARLVARHEDITPEGREYVYALPV